MPMNQEVIPKGQGLDQTKSLQCRDFTWALHNMEKSISPLFPGPLGSVVANDWCISLKGHGS